MTCTCISPVNRQLRIGGTQLKTMTALDEHGRNGVPRVLVRVEFTDSAGRRQQPITIATHCPFCGTKYED